MAASELFILYKTSDWRKLGTTWAKFWQDNICAVFISQSSKWDIFLPFNLEKNEDMALLSGQSDNQENAKIAADNILNSLCKKYSEMNIKAISI